ARPFGEGGERDSLATDEQATLEAYSFGFNLPVAPPQHDVLHLMNLDGSPDGVGEVVRRRRGPEEASPEVPRAKALEDKRHDRQTFIVAKRRDKKERLPREEEYLVHEVGRKFRATGSKVHDARFLSLGSDENGPSVASPLAAVR